MSDTTIREVPQWPDAQRRAHLYDLSHGIGVTLTDDERDTLNWALRRVDEIALLEARALAKAEGDLLARLKPFLDDAQVPRDSAEFGRSMTAIERVDWACWWLRKYRSLALGRANKLAGVRAWLCGDWADRQREFGVATWFQLAWMSAIVRREWWRAYLKDDEGEGE